MTAYKLVHHTFEHLVLRCFWDTTAWRYSIVDFVGILTGNKNAQLYWHTVKSQMTFNEMNKQPLQEWQNFEEASTKFDGLTLVHTDTNGLFILLENIQSDKTERVRAWLGEVFETWVE
jgi:hypothetical protein